jgi:hypothetical protein
MAKPHDHISAAYAVSFPLRSIYARHVAEQSCRTLLQEDIRLNTTNEQKRAGWETAAKIQKSLCTVVLHETYGRRV